MRWVPLFVGLVITSPALAQDKGLTEFAFDAGHSLVGFNIGFLHTTVRGEFDFP